MTQPRYSVCHMVGVGPRPPRCQPFPCSRSESAAVSDSGCNRSLLSCWWFSTRASVKQHSGQEKCAVSFQIQTFPLSQGRVIWVARLLKIFYDVLNPEYGSTLSCTVQPLGPFSLKCIVFVLDIRSLLLRYISISRGPPDYQATTKKT